MGKITISNLSFCYNKRYALTNINCGIESSGLVCLIGPNGSGKSTLLKCIAGLLNLPPGKLFIDGKDINKIKTRELAMRVAYVPQISPPPVGFTVREIVMMGRYPHKRSPSDRIAVDKALEMTNMKGLSGKDCARLSGGEYQRTLIARCIAQEAAVMLLDEPISHLDIRFQIEIMETLRNICSQSGTLIITSLHDLNFATIYGTSIMLLNGGKLHNMGCPGSVINCRSIHDVYHTELSSFSPDGTFSLFYPQARTSGRNN